MSDPYIVVNQYTNSATGHVNVSFYNSGGTLVGTYGANVADYDNNPFNGMEGGVYDETFRPGTPAQQSTLYFSQSDWSNALNFAQGQVMNPNAFYSLAFQNCVDFANDVLIAGGHEDGISHHLIPGTPTYYYAEAEETIFDHYSDWYTSLQSSDADVDMVRNWFEQYYDWTEVLDDVSKFFTTIDGMENDLENGTFYSPIVIDTNGNGFQTTMYSQSEVKFDLDSDGTANKVAWLAKDSGDGFLVVDKNHNGQIDNGSEMFGGASRGEGFAALAKLDDNGDGFITAQDRGFADLKVWLDANGDARTDPGELKSLDEIGITSLATSYYSWDLRNHGNIASEHSYATLDDQPVRMSDFYFRGDFAVI